MIRNACIAMTFNVLCYGVASAVPTEWTTTSGGNGHFYMSMGPGLSATDARVAAAGLTLNGQTGYLATITSQEEHDFLIGLVGSGENIWIGGSDSAAEGEWRWDQGPETGDLIAPFAAWGLGEPNDLIGEDYLAAFWNGTATWNDVAGVFTFSYLVEFNAPTVATPIPVPGSALYLISGLLGIGFVARKYRS